MLIDGTTLYPNDALCPSPEDFILMDEDDTARAMLEPPKTSHRVITTTATHQATKALKKTSAHKIVIKRQKKHSRQQQSAESCCASDNGSPPALFGQQHTDFEVAGAVAKAITAIHRALNVPLEHMKAIANPVLLCTCSSPGCSTRTKPSSFFCAEHCSMFAHSQPLRFESDAASVDQYLAKLRSLARV